MSETRVSREGHEFNLVPWSCPTCGPGATTALGRRGGPSHRYGFGLESVIHQCRSCGLLFPNPFPVPAEGTSVYEDPATYFSRHSSEEKVRQNRRILRTGASRLGRAPRVLDVGAGLGEALVAGREEGLEVRGIEVSPETARHAKECHGVQVDVLTAREAAERWPGEFDLVLLNAVLEHVHDPAELIASVKTVLKPGGLLYVDVPNEPNLLTMVGNGLQKVMGKDVVYNLSPTWSPYHVYGFNPRSLRALLGRFDFTVEFLEVFAPPCVQGTQGFKDRGRALVANQIERLANWTGTAANLSLWARRGER